MRKRRVIKINLILSS